MICPVCKKGALIVEYRDIELDYCPSCGGVWFDASELELLMERAGLANYRDYFKDMIAAPEAESAEKKRKCPICRHKMKKTYIDDKKKILVDICHVGDGIWFDSGEVGHLVDTLYDTSTSENAFRDLLSFVGDMFKCRRE